MTYTTNQEEFALPLPITQTARHTAQQFASLQPTAEKAEQVRLNTLAVHVVKDYLDLMGIATSLTAGDSWNPVVQLCADISDLEVEGLGRLECRPVRQQQRTCHIPPEVWQDRIGYVVVQIDENNQNAVVLGFTPTAEVEELPLSRLQAPEALLDRLAELRQPAVSLPSVSHLSQWFQNVFESGWQTIDTLLNPPEMGLAYAFRGRQAAELAAPEQNENRIRRAKLVDLGIQLADRPIALNVELSPRPTGETGIYLRVLPITTPFLPPNLRLAVLDDTGATFLEAQSRNADNYLQLELSGQAGERFSVRVSLGDASVTEDFVI